MQLTTPSPSAPQQDVANDVHRKMAKGAAWMVLFKFCEKGLGLISTVILARLLLPADFGLVAMAMSVIAILELMNAFNFDIALIQKQDADRSYYDTAWTLNVLLGLAAAVGLAVLAAPTARFYDEPRLNAVILVLAISTLVRGFENVGVVAFRKQMEFNKEFAFRLVRKLAGFVVAVPLAFALRNYWALVAGMVVSTIASVGLSFVVHPYRPRLALSAGRDLMTFSKWIMFNLVLRVVNERFAYFVIGKLSGARGLGLFTMGYEISNLPTTELVAPINRAVYPGYAKLSKDLALLRESYLNVVSLIALLALPAAAGIAALASLLVPVFLGQDWIEIVPVMRLLGAYGALMSLQSNVYSAFVALGRPNVMTWLAVLRLAAMIPLVGALTYHYGVIGASWAYLIANSILLVANYGLMFRTLGLPLGHFLDKMWRPPLAAVIMYVTVDRLVKHLVSSEVPQTFQLALAVVVGVVVYVGLVFGLWLLSGRPAGAERAVLKQVRAVVGRRFAGRS